VKQVRIFCATELTLKFVLVLVLGAAGGVGLAAVELAKAMVSGSFFN